jgi:hypothetical protein
VPPGRREQGGPRDGRGRSAKHQPAQSGAAPRAHRARRPPPPANAAASGARRRGDDPSKGGVSGRSRRPAGDQPRRNPNRDQPGSRVSGTEAGSRASGTDPARRAQPARSPRTSSPRGRPQAPRREAEPTHGRRTGRAPGATPERPASGASRTAVRKPPRPASRDTTTAQPRAPRALEPPLPDDVDPRDLDREVRRELQSLPPTLARKVAAHLVAAGHLLDTEPERAHAHAAYAKRLASRVAAVREAAGITAYRVGRYADALADLRAARRMTGRPDHLPVMADCERGLARPERALALARDPQVDLLAPAEAAELRIVVSGARRDLGEYGAAVAVFDDEDIHPRSAAPWTVRVWYAYAEALLAAGRREQARRYFAAATQIDEEGETDAAERLADLGDEPA